MVDLLACMLRTSKAKKPVGGYCVVTITTSTGVLKLCCTLRSGVKEEKTYSRDTAWTFCTKRVVEKFYENLWQTKTYDCSGYIGAFSTISTHKRFVFQVCVFA